MLSFLRRRWMWVALVAIVLVVGGAWFGQAAKAKKVKAQQAAAAKSVTTPYSASASGKVDVEGGIIQVAARTAGVVRDVYVQEGDEVTKGQVLARLEDDQPQAERRQRRRRRAAGARADQPHAGAEGDRHP